MYSVISKKHPEKFVIHNLKSSLRKSYLDQNFYIISVSVPQWNPHANTRTVLKRSDSERECQWESILLVSLFWQVLTQSPWRRTFHCNLFKIYFSLEQALFIGLP